jgi:hypothetical protein
MTEPFLILHKVRGQPAFDIAIRMKCPLCADGVRDCDEVMCDCGECQGSGYWWIIPTSGHRAYPSDYIQLDRLQTNIGEIAVDHMDAQLDDLPDHYQNSIDRKALSDSSPIKSPELQLVLRGLIKPAAPLARRKL